MRSDPRAASLLTPQFATLVVGFVTALRLIAAYRLPLTGDEAYYWTWSRHLAFGYVDHPPAVAWLIALGTTLGTNSGNVRLPFVCAEALTAFALARSATLASGDARAGAIAAIAFTLTPQEKLAIGEALPDGPYVLCWALALWACARIDARPAGRTTAPDARHDAVPLGLALGGAILSRAFGWALVFGVAGYLLMPRRRASLRAGVWLAFPLALALYVPFIVWNAHHQWANFAFTLHDRQPFEALSIARVATLSTLRFLVIAALLLAVGARVAWGPPRDWLVAWTALPFPALLVVLSLTYPIESYWVLGPYASLCVGIGVSLARGARRSRRVWAVLGATAAAVTIAPALFLALPEAAQAAVLQGPGRPFRGALVSGVFAYEPLARDLEHITRPQRATILTDRPEIAAELGFHGVPVRMIGGSPDIPELRRYMDPPRGAGAAIVVRYRPLAEDPRLLRGLRPQCGSIEPGRELQYRHAGVRSETFYLTSCGRLAHMAPERNRSERLRRH